MMPVTLAREPAHFDAAVRQKGLSAIDEMVGREPRQTHTGPRREKIADLENDIPSAKFPSYWRDALPDLLSSYERRCAFLALFLERATGNPSVDHMLPKSKQWYKVYEWDNYRLCAASFNALKNDIDGLVDPFDCQMEWFALEFVGFQVTRGPEAPTAQLTAVDATLELLNNEEFRKSREEYVVDYEKGDIKFGYLKRRAPFIAYELHRQGRLLPGDQW
jgi:hypothetical protein